MHIPRRAFFQLLAATAVFAGCTTATPPEAPAVPSSPPMRRAGPPTVRIERRRGRYRYRVNGVDRFIQGMGYNVLYRRRQLPAAEREMRLRRDFGLLRAVGANTIQSWQEREVDGVHLDLAREYGLDVILYYHLSRGYDYADPVTRAWHRHRIRVWIESWRHHPAVVMWGIGNEVLLGASPAEAEAFAEFYVRVVRDVVDLDPSRPVVYREAEDLMVPYFREAFAVDGAVPDQFVYGLNFYTPRVRDVLAGWEQHQFDVPLLISELSPTGLSLDERPEGFRRLWQVVAQHSDRVIGGAIYTWTTEGPEATDHLFGLVNDDTHPLDASLMVLSEIWGGSYGQPRANSVVVPDLVGKTEPEARAAAFASGLLLQTVEGRGLRGIPGSVRAQRPRLGEVVPRGSSVRVVVPPRPASQDDSRTLVTLLTAARELALQATGESLDSFEQRRGDALATAIAELQVETRDGAGRSRAEQLAEWRAWIQALAVAEHDGEEVFPGAENIVPVIDGLARFALQDARAFVQAESFTRAAVAEWISAAGGS